MREINVGPRFTKAGLFIYLCATLLPNSYYSLNPNHLSFIEDIENFKGYRYGINVHKELLRELWLCKGVVF